MLAHVGQRLLGNAVGNHLRLRRRAVLQHGLQLDVDVALLFHGVEVLSQRGRKSAFIQGGRSQLEQQVTQPVGGLLDILL